MKKIIARIKNIDKTYETGKQVVSVLKDVSLDIFEEEIIVIYGKSGSGKSTLLSTLGGINKPDHGEVFIKNQSLYDLSENKLVEVRSKNIGYIFQSYNLIDDYTALQNIRLPFYIQKRKIDNALELEILEMLDIKNRSDFYPNQLSGGEKQRVGIARALLQMPSIIIADEPTGNLDAVSSHQLMDYIKKSNQSYRQTIIIVTHDHSWFDIASRVFRLENGKLLEENKCG